MIKIKEIFQYSVKCTYSIAIKAVYIRNFGLSDLHPVKIFFAHIETL